MIIFTDGTAEPNPGPAAIGAIIKDEQGRVITSISQRIGIATNNQAEYRAIIAALEEAIRLGATHVELNSDSELVVRQISGRYRVKNAALKPLYQQVIPVHLFPSILVYSVYSFLPVQYQSSDPCRGRP